ncbi:phage tail tip protein [Escherichia coli]|uniref:phage tail tip domain-containing protein n=1 Tax=Escherichia coli TaxID=562 RepID=UPI003974DE18
MGKGSSKGHTPREAKDNLKSTQLLSAIDAISEGPIEGPVDGLKSVLLNSTPVLDSEGNTNISGVTVVFRAGEQEQSPPEGFESSGSETVLGTEVKYETPITRTITSANIDRLRFTFGVQALVETTSKGDRNPSEVRLLVQIQRNGGWVTEKDITIKGKTTSQYLASVVVDNLPPRPFNIRMRRMTPDSTTDQLQNKTLWSSYTEIIDVKQCYPNTALVGVQVDSEQFSSQQVSRNYHLRGRILQVPSNYNPQTRQYSGIWDGTFKPAYSNNPAWCLWDMLTHPRYGMGKRLGAADVDKWALYVIGQYCDQSVPDGFGGTEPRITCNAYLTTQRKAWDVLSDFCSAMRCMPVWNGQTLTFVQDRPSDKVWTYNRSNVVMPDDGAPFRYSFSALKDRHNAVEVNWIDPNNGWETATELVEDTQAIARYGRNVTKMDAFGCTSRGQAHRAGLWLIKTELLETQTVDFSVGAEGLRHVPGDVIEICDDDYAGISTGGRVLAVNSQTRTLTLDREITLPSSGTTLISLVDGSGNPVSVEVQSVTDGVKVKVSRVPDGVAEYSVWGLKLPTLRQRLFLDFFKGEIGKSHLAQELWTQIDNGQLAPDLAEIRTSITDVSNEITQTVNKKLEDQSAAIQQIQKVQVDTNNNLNSMWAVKLQQMQDGRLYIAGIGAGIENTPDGMQSQVLLAADRIAMVNPVNGNTKPMFVGQGDQIFMNEVFLKYLTAPTITSGGNPPAFSLTPDGRLTAKNADISGNVNANSGTLNNVTINENCRVLGKLSANQIEGDLVKTVGKAFPRDSRAPERWPSGTITVRIYDDQPFDRQIVIPAVAFSGAKHEREHTDIYSSCRLIVRKNGAEIYNRTALDNTLIYSGVIDMPAGHGHMTLEFSVSAWLVNDWYPTASISDLLVVVMKKATAGITIS